MHCRAVYMNLYLVGFIKLNIDLATSIFKHDLFQVKGLLKYFKHIRTAAAVMNKKVFF